MAKICIDIGHYKGYNVSPAVPEYAEGTRMWDLGKLLIAELKERGVEVVQTRTSVSKDLALVTRGKKAQGCDLFLSLHSNAVGSAINENVDYPLAIIMRDNDRTDRDEKSEEIGKQLAQIVEDMMGTKQRAQTRQREIASDRDGNGLKDDEYYGVLQGAKMVDVPGVILEHSFHTNTRATKWLLDDANLAKLAKAEAECIAKWLASSKTETKPAIKMAGAQSKDEKAKGGIKYKVTAFALNVRSGPDSSKTTNIIKVIKHGETVVWYGYHTKEWYYVQLADGSTGYINNNYIAKA